MCSHRVSCLQGGAGRAGLSRRFDGSSDVLSTVFECISLDIQLEDFIFIFLCISSYSPHFKYILIFALINLRSCEILILFSSISISVLYPICCHWICNKILHVYEMCPLRDYIYVLCKVKLVWGSVSLPDGTLTWLCPLWVASLTLQQSVAEEVKPQQREGRSLNRLIIKSTTTNSLMLNQEDFHCLK